MKGLILSGGKGTRLRPLTYTGAKQLIPLVEEFRSGQANCQILLYRVPNPESFGVADVRGDRIVRIVEKPKDPPSDLAIVGIYMFDHNVFDAIERIRPSARGELEITDTIQVLIDQGFLVVPKIITILEYSRVVDIPHRIEESLIGRNVEIVRSPIKPRGYKLVLGDYSKVGIL